jgi:putative peptidoglycan lipid II flippase
MLANSSVDWIAMRAQGFKRIGLLALVMIASAAIYFIALWATGMKLRQLVRR